MYSLNWLKTYLGNKIQGTPKLGSPQKLQFVPIQKKEHIQHFDPIRVNNNIPNFGSNFLNILKKHRFSPPIN